MSLTKLIVRRPVAAFICIMAIVVFGVIALSSMEQESTPEMEMPMLIVYATYSGVDPENMDKLVTTPIEGAISSQSGVDTIYSMTNEGSSFVILQYEYGTDMDTAYIDLKESLDRIARSLPDDVDTPMVMKMSMNQSESMSISIRSESKDNLLYYVEDEISPEFEKLSSVAQVNVGGGEKEYISIELMADKLQQYGLNMSAIANSVSNADFTQSVGTTDYGSQELSITSSTSYKTVEELQKIPITLSDGSVIHLSEVADVYDAVEKSESYSRYNGEETISIGLTKRQESSAVRLSEQAKAVVDKINASGEDVTLEVMSDDADTIQEAIQSVFETLILGVIISMVILLVFLGDLRASLIVGSAMPISLLIAFIGMYFMDFTLNTITMGALVLGVGMMVDNSIVVLDSCFKTHSPGKDYADTAIKGTQLVTLSIAAGTLTTVVVFLPLANIGGIVGQLFRPLGYTIAFALLASLLSAMTLVPFFYTRFKPLERKNIPAAKILRRVERAYGSLVSRIVKKKKTVTLITIALVAVSLLAATQLNMEMMSSTDEGRISLSVETRPGVKAERINEIVLSLEEMVSQNDQVESYEASAGGGGGMFSSGSGSVSVKLMDNRKVSTADLVEEWRIATQDYLDCTVTVASESYMTGSMSSDEVSIQLQGSDYDTLKEFSEEVVEVYRQHPDIITATTSLSDGDPQLDIVVDDFQAARYGLTPAQVAGNIRNALSGIDAATVTRDGQDYTVTVEYPEGKYESYSDLTDMVITTATGENVPLADIVEFEFTNSAQTISKEDGNYYITISGTPYGEKKFDAEKELQAKVEAMNFPESVSLHQSAMQQMMDDEFNNIYLAIVIAVLLVFMVMAIQFESLKHAVMVMTCIPMCLIGSFGLLFLTGTTLNMNSLLGFLVLVGTVVNNGILFVDTTNEYRKSMDVETALVSTARTRLRPILMTTLTTVLSMIPMAMAWGTGSEMMQGLGLVVIGGLTASTILTLLVLPTFYLIIDGNPEKKAKREEKRRLRTEKRHQKFEAKENITRE